MVISENSNNIEPLFLNSHIGISYTTVYVILPLVLETGRDYFHSSNKIPVSPFTNMV